MHVITGEIRKEPRIKQGSNGTLYVVELSESFKDRDGQRQYTNYTFFFNAKTEGLNAWYSEAFQVGKVISVSCETLKHEVRDYEGKQYVTLMPADWPKLLFSQRGGQPQQQHMNMTQSQPAPQQQPQPQPMQTFDDDIPF